MEDFSEIVDANKLAICFLSVIKIPFSRRLPIEEEPLLPFILRIAFQIFWLVVLEVSFEHKFLQDVFFCSLATNGDLAR